MELAIQCDATQVTVTGEAFAIDLSALPQSALNKVFAYGLQRILNDAAAGAKGDAEAGHALAAKRWDNLVHGVIRATSGRESNPYRAEAKRIALGKVAEAPTFRKWLAENNLKAGDKAAKAKAAEMAEKLSHREDVVALAKKTVDDRKSLDFDVEI